MRFSIIFLLAQRLGEALLSTYILNHANLDIILDFVLFFLSITILILFAKK